VIVCGAVAVLAGFVPLAALSELVSIGTLFAFVVVCLGVLVLRRTRPDLPRAFRVPAVPWVPLLGVLACGWLMLNLPLETWLRFVLWMAVGLVLYGLYGRRHSRFAETAGVPATAPGIAPATAPRADDGGPDAAGTKGGDDAGPVVPR